MKVVIEQVLSSLYQQFGASVVFSVLFMIVYMYAEKEGWRSVLKSFCSRIKTDRIYRLKLCLSFYIAMILFRTLFCRELYMYPLRDVIGKWDLYDTDGNLITEGIENVILFIPFTWLYLAIDAAKLGKIMSRYIVKSVLISFGLSVSIEFLQLFLKLGTFQLSDLFFNTLGGFIGGVIFWICITIKDLADRRI